HKETFDSMKQDAKPGFFGRLFGLSKKEKGIKPGPDILLKSTGPTPDYQPDPVDICFCGSGKFFKSCCGSMEENRPPPFGVFIFENYLSAEHIKKLRDQFNKLPSEPLMIIDNELSTPEKIVNRLDDQRKSERVDTSEYSAALNFIVRSAFVELADKCFKRKMDWFEVPQLLRYYPGGFYQGHADSENMDPKTRCWNKVIDRDLSMLIYLNDDFEGGELSFDKFHYKLRPKSGTAVIFPSDNRYMHTAHTVHEGMRQAIVSWGSVQGIEKISSKPPENAILIEYANLSENSENNV
ncbi:MAG: 2OG-Fe(II) oxygenase, partial [Gammaproteobacteria bacterium]|nr:2OG-Fe(II) oxygenase [Gammaproteobacteria bacterium]